MSFRIDVELSDLEWEILVDCLYYWSKWFLDRVVQIILSRYSLDDQLKIMNILKKYDGGCNPVDIENTATTFDEEVEKLAECLEHNRAILEEIAEVLGIDINASVDVGFCIEEAIEWASGKR